MFGLKSTTYMSQLRNSGRRRKRYAYINDTHRENCVLLNSMQELIEIEAWLLMTFFQCLHNHLISIHSIATYYREQVFEECDSLNR